MAEARRRIRILIADDHAIFRDGLRKLLEAQPALEVVGEAADGFEAVELARKLKPDVLLLDLAMRRRSGLAALPDLAESSPEVRTILLTAEIEKPQIVEALQAGARGVVLKESATQLLLKSIQAVMAGEFWIGRDSVDELVRYIQAPPESEARRKFGLTPRELQVVGTIVAGYTNKEIARELSLSEETVKHHLSNIFDKCGVSNRLELALFAVNHRLTEGS